MRKRRGQWEVVRPSFFARRITGYTPIRIGGPAAGHDLLKTSADPTGKLALGTLNNCAMGYTPWGSYLACEENFNGYFRKTGTQTPLERRYGISAAGFGYLWHTTETRFNANLEPNEPNRFGWVTEIYPYLPHSTPVKRTALGRFKHEGAWVQEARDGRVVVYSGDDEQFEYIYRYVSRYRGRSRSCAVSTRSTTARCTSRKFNADGTGEWLPLTPENPALSHLTLAEILINTRGAADLVGATKMDRPEWIDTFPDKLTAIATLTNNTRRGRRRGAPNSRRYDESRAPTTSTATSSSGRTTRTGPSPRSTGTSSRSPATRRMPRTASTIVGDKYGSPDGIYVDPSGLLWIQTDVSGSTINTGAYAGFGNNQMLAADPDTRETRRFLTGPYICEITGVFMTPDRRTMFVGVQHPGEAPSGAQRPGQSEALQQLARWRRPAAGRARRPIVVTKDDGGVIGS